MVDDVIAVVVSDMMTDVVNDVMSDVVWRDVFQLYNFKCQQCNEELAFVDIKSIEDHQAAHRQARKQVSVHRQARKQVRC